MWQAREFLNVAKRNSIMWVWIWHSSRLLIVSSLVGRIDKTFAVSDYELHHICLYVRPRGTTRLPLDGFSWNFVLVSFTKICWPNSSFVKIGGKSDAYIGTYENLWRYPTVCEISTGNSVRTRVWFASQIIRDDAQALSYLMLSTWL